LASVIAGLVLALPHQAAAQHQAAFIDTGTVTFVTDQTASDIDPANDEVAGSDALALNIAEPLVAFDGASISRYKPALATRWTVNANHSVYTFYLRHGVRFHTGRCCLTADDVKYSIGRTVTLKLAASYVFSRFLTNPDKQIKILDPYTVQFDLGQPQPLFLGAVASEYTGLILDAQALRAHQTNHDLGHGWAQDHDLGTGPYMIQTWQHGQQITLVRFPAYWGGWSGRHFGTAIIRTVPEPTTRRELLERGEADITFDLTPQDDVALEHTPTVQVIAPYALEVDYIYMSESGPLASTAARQALSYAMNYDAVIKGVYKGFARRAYGCVPSTMLGYHSNAFHYQTDLAKAKALLQKAGVAPGTTLTYMDYNSLGDEIGLILQAQLAQIGYTLKLQHVDEAAIQSVIYGTEPPSKRPNLIAWGWWPDYNDPYDMCVPLLASYSAGAAGANGGFYHNAQVDALLNRMKNAGGEELVTLAHRMQQAQALDPANIWTDEPAQVTILAHNLHGYVANPVQLQTYSFYSMYRS
jgi:peptide/nickel transport system substrate-binding protein